MTGTRLGGIRSASCTGRVMDASVPRLPVGSRSTTADASPSGNVGRSQIPSAVWIAMTPLVPSDAARMPTGGAWYSGMCSASMLTAGRASNVNQSSTCGSSLPKWSRRPRALSSLCARWRNTDRSSTVAPCERTRSG